uniref:CID domain-containing protein n=1 Tax=Syphacia muris TaxID=451379 RepID=A0A0N5AMV6_9BILA
MPKKQRKGRKFEIVDKKEEQSEAATQEPESNDEDSTDQATASSFAKLQLLEEQLAIAHNSSIDFHSNLKNAITLMQQIVIQFAQSPGSGNELNVLTNILSQMTQMSLFLDVYSDYVKFVFCEGLMDPDHCDVAIRGIRRTMNQAITLINIETVS